MRNSWPYFAGTPILLEVLLLGTPPGSHATDLKKNLLQRYTCIGHIPEAYAYKFNGSLGSLEVTNY